MDFITAGLIWVGAALLLGLLAGPVLSMTNPDPPAPDRRVWKRRRSDV